jgi:PAS domain S-box-containing protein
MPPPPDNAPLTAWRDVFARWSTGVVIVGPDGVIEYANPAFREALGYASTPLEGRPFLELTHEHDRLRSAQLFQDVHEGKRDAFVVEQRCIRKDGAYLWSRVSASALRPSGTEKPRVVAVVEDHTERREAHERIMEGEHRFRLLAESMPFIVWTALPDGQIDYYTRPLATYTGLTDEVLAGRGWLAAVHPDDVANLTEVWERSASTRTAYSTEGRLHRHDGEYRWHLVRSVPIHDRDGNVSQWYGSMVDIHDRKEAEEHARLIAARLSRTLSSITDGFFTLDTAWCFTYLNREAERLLQRTSDELLGAYIWDEFPEARGTTSDVMYSKAMATGESVHFDQFYPPLDRWFDVRAYPSEDGLAVYFQDVSEERASQARLRESEERFRGVARATAHAVWDWNLRTDNVWWSDGIETTFGVRRSDLPPDVSSWTDLVHPEDLDRVVRGIHEVIEGDSEAWEDRYRFKKGDGVYVPVYDRGYVIRDESGTPLRMVGGVSDESERVESERRIREQAELLAKAQDAIIVRELDHTIAFWNASAERLYGWSAEQAIGASIQDLLYDDPEPFRAATEHVMMHDEWVGELEQRRHDGTSITIEGRWTLVRDDDGRPSRILAINTDVTERKKLVAQFMRAQRLESIGNLAGGIAHDLNNVLAPILLSMDLLKQDATDPETLQILETVEATAKHGADLVRQVLSFARGIEGGTLSVDLPALIEDLARIVRDTFPKNITFRTDVPDGLWPLVGDPTQVHQVLMNLAVNARDAMPDGGVITVSAENVTVDAHYAALSGEATPGPYVRLSVDDTGTGMPPGIVDQIFDPFFTTKGVGEGTGLGLSTVSAIVRGHGGLVNVYSEPGKGTTFRIYLPAGGTPAESDEEAPVEVIRKGSGQLILVVDDEASVRTITKQTLEAFGYRVLTATDGADAVAIYGQRGHEIDLVLTDVMMPIMDGAALIRVLKRMNPEVRIVAASGLGQNGGVARAADSGVRHFLPKPYTATTLLDVLARVLARSE